MDPDALLDGLNPAQERAVTSRTSPLCILAGAGSGKTRVLTRRIAWRAATGDLDPSHVLALTFTRKAAGELTSRLRALGLRERLAAGTFHAIALAQLRARWAEAGIAPPEVLQRKATFVSRLLHGPTRTLPAIDYVTEIEWAKARMIDPASYADAAVRHDRRPPVSFEVMASVFEAYEQAKREARMIDFDDMLDLCRRDLTRDPDFAATQRWRFRHLFVDEFQDVNPLQYALLEAWRGDRTDLCVVGDPNQAIYAWNGADPGLLRAFPERFPGGEVVRLVQNYRSSPQILAVANAVLTTGGDGVDRRGVLVATRSDGPPPVITEFPDDVAEASGVARAVRDHHAPGQPWSAQAVLVRTNAQIPALEEALKKAQVPFRVRGAAPLLDQPEVKAALTRLRSARLGFAEAVTELASGLDLDDDDVSERVAERRANVDALVQLAHDYQAIEVTPSTEGFLAWLTSTTRGDRPDGGGDAVELCTFHAAKGLEWPVVHLAGIEQGYVPIGQARTPEALAEELRLFYVALTRAERELCITLARRRRFGDKDRPRTRSSHLEVVDGAIEALAAGIDPVDVGVGRRAPSAVRAADTAPRRTKGSGRPSGARVSNALDDLTDEQRALFDRLRAWRSDTARAASMPAFVVCNDATLLALLRLRPTDRTGLLAVPGIGPAKAERFGDELLALLTD